MPVTFTTDLPDASSLVLDASEAETITADWGDEINYGEYRLEIRDDDPDGDHPPYQHEITVGEATTVHTISNILGGEQYSIRLRTQTEHKTGSWLAAEEITKLLASDGLTLSNVTTTSIDLDWTINNDFRGSHQIYRKRQDYDYDADSDGRLVGSVADNVASYVDDAVAPDRGYEYFVRTLTQWQYADSGTATTTTDSIGLEDRAVPPRGWHVEIDHPSGTTVTPQILDDPVRRPTVNGYPRVELPAPQDETWHATTFDDAPLSVWHDGDREPIDRLEHRRLRPDRTVLEGRGGTQLERRVIEDVDLQPTHEFVEYLINEYTDYTANVDNPSNTQDEVVLQAADTDVELQQAFESIPSTVPLEVTSTGTWQPKQTCFNLDATALDLAGETSTDTATGGAAEGHTTLSDSLSITIPYMMPASTVGVGVRYRNTTSDGNRYAGNGFSINVDGQQVISFSDGFTVGDPNFRWSQSSGVSTDISGTVTVEFDGSSSSGSNTTDIDRIVVYDNRFSYTWDNTLHEAGGHLDGPEEFPDIVRHDLVPIETPLGIQEVTLDVQSDDGNGLAELALGEDGTETWNTVSNALTHTITYSQLATTARARIGVGRDTSVSRDTATPRTGYEPHALDSLELSAVLDDTPVLTNRSFDGKLVDVLREVASIGNFVFEVRESSSGTSFEWTQIDHRPVDVDPDLADYEIDRQTEDIVEKAVVYGGAQRITRQLVTVTVDSWIDLPFPNSRIVEGKETIYDGSTEFERGSDYEIQYTTEDGQPQIQALSGGALSDGQTVSVDADVKPRGEHTVGDTGSNPRTIVEDVPGLASKQMCDQVALFLVEETGQALTEAEVTVPHDSVEWSVIEAIDPKQLPTDGPMQVREIESNASQTILRLASRQSVGEVVQDIRQRTQRALERV